MIKISGGEAADRIAPTRGRAGAGQTQRTIVAVCRFRISAGRDFYDFRSFRVSTRLLPSTTHTTDLVKSRFSDPGHGKIDVLRPQSSKNQGFRTPDIDKSRFCKIVLHYSESKCYKSQHGCPGTEACDTSSHTPPWPVLDTNSYDS